MARLIAPVPLMTLAALLAGALVRPVPVHAEILVFTAFLSPANEVPPVAVNPTENSANGSAIVTLDFFRSGNTVTSATAKFDFSIGNLVPNTSIIIGAHVHEGTASVNGPIRIDSGLSPSNDLSVGSSGVVSFTKSGIPVAPSVAQAIIDALTVPDTRAGSRAVSIGFYFNVHTVRSPDGVARGQLTAGDTVTPATVPTLSQWGAAVMTLLLMATALFFLRGRRAGPSPQP